MELLISFTIFQSQLNLINDFRKQMNLKERCYSQRCQSRTLKNLEAKIVYTQTNGVCVSSNLLKLSHRHRRSKRGHRPPLIDSLPTIPLANPLASTSSAWRPCKAVKPLNRTHPLENMLHPGRYRGEFFLMFHRILYKCVQYDFQLNYVLLFSLCCCGINCCIWNQT